MSYRHASANQRPSSDRKKSYDGAAQMRRVHRSSLRELMAKVRTGHEWRSGRYPNQRRVVGQTGYSLAVLECSAANA
jgi:hypothetical protein